MIKATFYKNVENDSFIGFDIKGHSGYASAGSDIVCASVSAMVMLFVNMANDVFEAPFDFKSDDKKAEIRFSVKKTNETISKGIKTLCDCILSVSEEYSDFVKVTVKPKG